MTGRLSDAGDIVATTPVLQAVSSQTGSVITRGPNNDIEWVKFAAAPLGHLLGEVREDTTRPQFWYLYVPAGLKTGQYHLGTIGTTLTFGPQNNTRLSGRQVERRSGKITSKMPGSWGVLPFAGQHSLYMDQSFHEATGAGVMYVQQIADNWWDIHYSFYSTVAPGKTLGNWIEGGPDTYGYMGGLILNGRELALGGYNNDPGSFGLLLAQTMP